MSVQLADMKCIISQQFLVILLVAQSAFCANIHRHSETHTAAFSLSLGKVQNITGTFKYTVETINEEPETARLRDSLQRIITGPLVTHSQEDDMPEVIEIHNLTQDIIEESPVPEGYENVSGIGYYKIHTDPFLPWREAKRKCEEEGAHLVVIDSEEERKVEMTLYGRHSNLLESTYFAWIGYSDIETEGEYMSVLGEPLPMADYIRWTTNSHGTTEDNCMGATMYGEINDLYCDGERIFICELPQQ